MSDPIQQLKRLQHHVTAGNIAHRQRDQLAFDLWASGRMNQREIWEILNETDVNAGGEGISASTIQKAIARRRVEAEQFLLHQAARSIR